MGPVKLLELRLRTVREAAEETMSGKGPERFGRSPAVKDFSAFALSTSALVSTVTLLGGGLVVPDVKHRLRVRRRHHHRMFQRRDPATIL
ncbi:hypothetical protein QJS10_CPB13g00284 [Acorus calamus]|uniref:Uncharacterized protein n=1 Tax=Acorus calamus TaxID=4465 RepID=A0AAV9DJ28_ACOCL|nr:hypothetical protein QJS10_CPB13g00284 [Acorus calamus]